MKICYTPSPALDIFFLNSSGLLIPKRRRKKDGILKNISSFL